MNLESLTNELRYLGIDRSFIVHATDWINDAVLEIASDFELSELKLREPTSLSTTESDWLYDLPATYHKKVFKCRNSEYTKLPVNRSIGVIEELDYDHDETGDDVTNMAVEGGQVAIFPKADDTLYLWYYRLPVAMSLPADTPDGIPSAYHERVIIPKIIIKNFHLISGMKDKLAFQHIEYWQNRYRVGLYGEPRGDVGLINFIAKSRSIKKTGGRDPLP